MSIIQAIIGTNLTISAGSEEPVVTADFTIEWWQKVEDSANNCRPWSIGFFPTQLISVSYENMVNDYFWINNSIVLVTSQNHVGAGWRHMAYVRSGSIVRGYINGIQYTGNTVYDGAITATNIPLYVGAGEGSAAGRYQGYITNLHIVKGVAKYTGNFTPSLLPITAGSGSVFLMPALDDTTKYADTVGSKSVGQAGAPAWSSDSPFTAAGPYSQYSNVFGNNIVDFNGLNYNADLLNVRPGWTVTDGVTTGVVTAENGLVSEDLIRFGISFTNTGPATWTFTQPAIGGSVYFDTTNYLNYGASADWAMDV